ncbi:MAG: VacB/RNase II family 3'-5' exoribonuclease [Bacilli bacterium]|nr:VacB/RNase II family 3'-5' exoribonuclease [Bacilli bacterium]
MVELEKLLLRYLETLTSGVKIKEICDNLGLSLDEKEIVLTALHNLEVEGKVYMNKHREFMLMSRSSKKYGTVSVNRHGVGVLLNSNIKISKENLGGALPGDIVVLNSDGGRDDYYVEKILKRGFGSIACGIIEEDGHKYAMPISDNEFLRIEVDESELADYVEGDLISVELDATGRDDFYRKTSQRKRKKGESNAPTHHGTVKEYLGNVNDPNYDIEVIANKHGFYKRYPKEVEEEVKKIPEDISGEDLSNRRDYRKKIVFTIDGEDTKDIDDAISLEILPNGNYLLGVHIADVSHYVKPGSALFEEARRRGTSLYILDRVIAMLPKKLSNGICSLKPNVDRLTKTCEMEITKDGQIVNSNVFHSVIRSRKQMTYTAVNQILEEGVVPEGYEEYSDILLEMGELAKALDKRRIAEGKIDFYSHEVKTKTNEKGDIISVKANYQRSAERLIENFMVAANTSVAKMFANLPFIFRIHESIDRFKLRPLFNKIANILPNGLIPKSMHNRDIQSFLERIKNTKFFAPISLLILKCMSKAKYSDNNLGHCGLGLRFYTHFTSPIRRFSDLVVHNLIDLYLSKDFEKKRNDKEFMDELALKVHEYAEQASAREVEGDHAEYEVLDSKMAEFMSKHKGEEFTGTILEMSASGMRVVFDDVYEGFVHTNNIEGEGKTRFNKDCLSITKGGEEYTLGDTVAVVIDSTSKSKGEISLKLKGHDVIKLYEEKGMSKSLTSDKK